MLPEGTATESKADSSQDGAGKESGQAVSLPEHLVGELSETLYAKLPAEVRTELSENIKSLKGNVTRKLQDVAELRRVKEALEADPDKAKFLSRAMVEYDAQKAGLKPEKRESSEAKSRLETLLEDIEPAQRKAVKEFIDGLDERYTGQLTAQEKELKEVKALVNGLSSSNKLTRAETLERELLKLPGAYKTLAVKHQEEILRIGTQPSGSRLSVQKLLQIVSEDDEYRKAVLATPEQGKSEVDRARETATSRPSGAVSGVETLVGKEDVIKSRDKRFGDQLNLGGIVTKLLKDIKRGA